MNVYGKAMTDTKRKANSKVVEMILKPQQNGGNRRPEEAGHGYWELMGVGGTLENPRNRLKGLVAGEGFEPSTFGL